MFVRVLNALLGLWLLASAFLFAGPSHAQFYNVLAVSLLVSAFGMASILGRHGARRLNFVLGLWLFISALALPSSGWGAMVNQLVCSILLVIVGLFPHVRYQGQRTAA